jgi:hypothetical protein
MKNDASMALSYPQNRTARRVWSYERLWFGKSITRRTLIRSSPVHDRSYRDWNQRTFIAEHSLQYSLDRHDNSVKVNRIFVSHWVNLVDTLSCARLDH